MISQQNKERVVEDITELSIAELFSSEQYVIPIYQRNYAWGEPEVEQLIQDVMDVAEQKNKSDYYVGSLVTYSRENGDFETIDGQQRHTTLSILLSVLKNEFKQDIGDVSRINLNFDSRPKSAQTLRKLFANPGRDDDQPEERSIRSVYEVAKRRFARDEGCIKTFTQYLLHHVKIFRVVVPKDTDLNHYFEIMNNRGEQLEKHEVLKARLMNAFKTDKERNCFAKVWDACADMNRYVQLGFEAGVRGNIFGKDWDEIPDDFNELCDTLSDSDKEVEKKTLASIISTPVLKDAKENTSPEEVGTFGSIVSFSNFLLHVLRLMTEEDVPLDDKRLLDSFSTYLGKGCMGSDPSAFIIGLLKTRMLFDCHIIKRESDEDWSLKTLRVYERKQKTFSYVNSFRSEKNNNQLIMLLSMFHVSFPAQVYKHWLNATLNYLYIASDEGVDDDEYLEFLEKLNDKFFYGRYGVFSDEEPIDYYQLTYDEPDIPEEFDTDYLEQATNVQNFIFNRLDYLLWRRLTAGEKFEGVNMQYVKKRLKGFSFTFRTSVEHYYPQNPMSDKAIRKSKELPHGVDTFGNLCLISRSNNSKLSNYLPTAKKEHYEKATTVESLKQVFMMNYTDWGPKSASIIAKHEEMMLEVLLD